MDRPGCRPQENHHKRKEGREELESPSDHLRQLARPLKAGASVRFEQARERARFEFDVFVPVPART